MSDRTQRPPLDEFDPFPKIARLRRSCLVTEKIDGSNAQVTIFPGVDGGEGATVWIDGELHTLRAGSRNRWITPQADNFGFARWAYEHADGLALLGPGRHYGEWWGQGIQRRYGLDEKRFSLFNVARWTDDLRPSCCHVVPTLYEGQFSTEAVDLALEGLRRTGSHAAPGFDRPEGVIVYHVASKTYGKVLLENDDIPKSVAEGLAS